MGVIRYGLEEFAEPHGIAIDQNNNIYVADSWNGRVQKINANDEFSIIGGSGTGNGEFTRPLGIAIAADGNIFVSDTYK